MEEVLVVGKDLLSLPLEVSHCFCFLRIAILETGSVVESPFMPPVEVEYEKSMTLSAVVCCAVTTSMLDDDSDNKRRREELE
jgi:hypothetical protein